MKYSLLVVDDEKIIREGIARYVEKHCESVRVDGVFADGGQVIEYLESGSADIIISDIKMAGVTGLELAKYVCMTRPEIKMIILSGYKKFEYAKEAMEYKVEEYLLKPVSNSEIIRAVENAVKKLDSERELADKLEQFDEILADMRSKFFLDLTLGSLGKNTDIKSEFDKLGFNFSLDSASAYVCSVKFDESFLDTWTYGKNGADTAIMNFLNNSESILYATGIDDGLYILLTKGHNICDVRNDIVSAAADMLGTELHFECLYRASDIASLKDYSSTHVKKFGDIDDSVKVQIFKLMNSYLNLGMLDNARELFAQLSDELSDDRMRELVDFLYENTFVYNKENRVSSGEMSAGDEFDYLCDNVRRSGEHEDDLIQKIKEFINKNYYNDITLESVANKVYLHSVYVSRYFKQHTGTNFSDYLFSVRMTHAINLLKTNKYKISKVGEMVGYKNYKYFSKQFKNYTGFTPKRYFREVWFVNVSEE